MAGDHKCPVCKSTFTRPQHVARHMRSHTGDRPYKCQHCGDQFARSDLLSRHINKCHASDKPPTTNKQLNLRRGKAAAMRAVTSKQACDQCVTASLPCDGANPCSKCHGRQARCTYVQFHRQTAPAGPGHPAPPVDRSDLSRSLLSGNEQFLLGAQPSATMDLASLYAHPYHLQHPDAYPQLTHLPPIAPGNSLSGLVHHRELVDNPDPMARFRTNADVFRTAVIPGGSLAMAQPAPSADVNAALPGLYASPQDGRYDRFDLPPQSAQWDPQRQYRHHKAVEPSYPQRSQGATSVGTFTTSGAGGEPTLQSHPPGAAPSSSYDGHATGHPGSFQSSTLPPPPTLYRGHGQLQHSHSDDVSSEGDFGSDAGSTAPSNSIPNSANSSAVHLPPPAFGNNAKAPTSGKGSYDRYENEQGSAEEGGFSSVFGLMSLDDPNVLAGIANDGQPFFSALSSFTPNNNSGLALPTPTQDLLAQLKSAGGKEGMDNKEMRDFWKQYLRTPLTGPNAANGLVFPLQTPTGPGAPLGYGQGFNGGRPSPTRRHSRVASLPSMKTPPLFSDVRLGHTQSQRPSTGNNESQSQNQPQQAPGAAGGYNSTVRSTWNDSEDLRSYEQAVLSRKPTMTLNIGARRKGSLAGSSPSQLPPVVKSKSMSPVAPHAPVGSKISELLNRPSSSSSTGTDVSASTASSDSGLCLPSNVNTANTAVSQVSSLAHAFGGEQPRSDGLKSQATEMQSLHESDPHRPSFKRIASQTLGPANSKRALLGPAGWGDHAEEDEDDEDDEGALEDDHDDEPQNTNTRMPMGTEAALKEGARRASLVAQAQG